VRRALALLLVFAILGGVVGCGGGGVSSGATVSAYVVSPLCAGAKRELARVGGRVDLVHIRVVCLPSPSRDGSLDLATVGANARRTTEDSASVAYIAPPDRAARFATPILDAADVASIYASSGTAAMKKLLKTIRTSSTAGSLRASVSDKLN
jgi:hypothetical protein